MDNRAYQIVRVAMAQINPLVGDLTGNTELILGNFKEAVNSGADIVVFPELAITGYPPEDLLLKKGFVRKNMDALETIAEAISFAVCVVGFVDLVDGDLFNAAAVIDNGRIVGVHHKNRLPNYGVFDEARYFRSGCYADVFQLGSIRFGVNICEDIWYPDGPAYIQSTSGGAGLVLVLNASPYHRGKWKQREEMLRERASDNRCVVCYLNTVGGQDELVFDGMSVVVSPDQGIIARGKSFEEQLIIADVSVCLPCNEIPSITNHILQCGLKDKTEPVNCEVTQPPDEIEEVYNALVLGVRDYVKKNGFDKVLIGLSGGIDSALTLAIACDAIGANNVLGVTMPSRYSSGETRKDAEVVASNFGCGFLCLPIEDVFKSYTHLLEPVFTEKQADITEENLQSRIRGNILMALSNKFGYLVLTTGNKSEMAVGYATIYGDMAGGFAVLKDVPKTLVWELSRWRNRKGEMIPSSTIERPPSAELRDNQKDTDNLPNYDILDGILQRYVEQDKPFDEIVADGFDDATVMKVMTLVDLSEYKRRQAPPGIKITPKAFGKDRRLPITNAYRDN